MCPLLPPCLPRALCVAAACSLLPPVFAQPVRPDAGRPLWEAGVAAIAAHQPDYPGAAQSHTRGLLAPFFIYRGPFLRVDEQGIRGRLVKDPDWEVDLAATGAFNARNDDARRGMPPLDYLFGVGPQLVYKGGRDAPGAPSLHLRLLAMASTNLRHLNGRGVTFAPQLRWRLNRGEAATWSASVQPHWASPGLQRYYYEVPAAYATADRPAYAARAGYLGTELALSGGWRVGDRVKGFASIGAMSLKGAANADSPLFRRTATLGVSVGLVWTPWRSAATAGD